ncbi:unnamed protein product [Sphenostylis stenocarpa]|uniref:Uncharacterized protein n=1 Tax=Sphenostylis stenocarpa TaxID=92480 RepID=A0AA86TK51_9FABA|nr:unnamed protein product [Sphenostylis stenocarpa]
MIKPNYELQINISGIKIYKINKMIDNINTKWKGPVSDMCHLWNNLIANCHSPHKTFLPFYTPIRPRIITAITSSINHVNHISKTTLVKLSCVYPFAPASSLTLTYDTACMDRQGWLPSHLSSTLLLA